MVQVVLRPKTSRLTSFRTHETFDENEKKKKRKNRNRITFYLFCITDL